MKEAAITVFTPTYNRMQDLDTLYQSLAKQVFKDFVWLIVDDGSTDNTRRNVLKWIDEGIVNIKYLFQENQGRFAAFNNAQPYFVGMLTCIVDSDDWLHEDSLLKLVTAWEKVATERYSGIIAYAEMETGELVGTEFPQGIEAERIYTLYDKYHIKGDKFISFRTDLATKYQYPIFQGEKFGGDSIVFNYINEECPMLLLRERITVKRFGGDTITNNLRKYHLSSKNGMREKYLNNIQYEKYNIINILKHTIGYVSYSIATKIKVAQIIKNSPRRLLTILMYPFGWGYYLMQIRGK